MLAASVMKELRLFARQVKPIIVYILKQNDNPFHILSQFLYTPFEALFVYVCYVINIAHFFHNISLALHVVTSIHSFQRNKK